MIMNTRGGVIFNMHCLERVIFPGKFLASPEKKSGSKKAGHEEPDIPACQYRKRNKKPGNGPVESLAASPRKKKTVENHCQPESLQCFYEVIRGVQDENA